MINNEIISVDCYLMRKNHDITIAEFVNICNECEHQSKKNAFVIRYSKNSLVNKYPIKIIDKVLADKKEIKISELKQFKTK